jgi:hypothetical protein
MSELVLFSLDVLVNMPRLYSNALEKALDGKARREDILEQLADSDNDILGIINEVYSEPRSSKVPEHIGSILERIGYGGESLRAYTQFLDTLGVGAHRCVKNKTYELLRDLRSAQVGVFYPMSESALLRVVNSSKLDHKGVDIVAGFDPERDIEDVIRKAINQSHGDRVLIVAKEGRRSPEYEQVAQMVNAEYLPCNEISEAPIGPVRRALKL